MKGTVKKYLDDRGFGFIKPDDGGPDVFFHFSACADGIVPDINSIVEFEIETDPRSGRTRAANVRPV